MSKYSDQIKLVTSAIVVILVGTGLLVMIDNNLREAQRLNADQMKLAGDQSPPSQRFFLRFACNAKSICKHYPDIRMSCAAAGNIKQCIDIRMKGESTWMCSDDGSVIGLNDKTTPSFTQCAAFKFSEFINN